MVLQNEIVCYRMIQKVAITKLEVVRSVVEVYYKS